MANNCATIQRVDAVNPIPGADRIEVLSVMGWSTVSGKGQYKVGDLVVFVQPDSVLPETPEFEEYRRFAPKRVRICQFRGQISQGLVLPFSILGPLGTEECLIGDDVSEYLGITHYEKQIPTELAGVVKGGLPKGVHKTDEESAQNVPGFFERHKGKNIYIAEKADGSSATFYYIHEEFGCCGRNWEYEESETNAYWRVARALDLETKLIELGKDIILQGELIGPGIQGNKYGLKELKFLLFNVCDPQTDLNYDLPNMLSTALLLCIETVPVLEISTFDYSLQELEEMSNRKSFLNPSVLAEGIVLRTLDDERDPETGKASIKIVSSKYLLANEDA